VPVIERRHAVVAEWPLDVFLAACGWRVGGRARLAGRRGGGCGRSVVERGWRRLDGGRGIERATLALAMVLRVLAVRALLLLLDLVRLVSHVTQRPR
jgi:hypothetical protein